MGSTLLHHRAPEFIPIFEEVQAGLKKVFGTEQSVLLLACSGTGAMETAVVNLISPGEQAIVVRGGKFGERWTELCQAYGVEPIVIDVEWGHAVDPKVVRDTFAAHPNAKTLLVQASETSTATYHPIRELCEVVRESPERRIIVDGISGVGVHALPMDAWGIDCLVSGSQKSWMLPPGLAMIAISPRMHENLKQCKRPRYYFDLAQELAVQPGASTAYTPAVSLICGLREALRIMFEEGIENVLARHEALARMTRAAMQSLGLDLLAPDSPSYACTAVRVPEGVDGKKLIKILRDRYSITVADGQGHLTGKILRIGHMGDVDLFDMLAAIAAVEMALVDIGYGIELCTGVRTAMEIVRAVSARA
jgi:aspartate aminotransferase-like enzyme